MANAKRIDLSYGLARGLRLGDSGQSPSGESLQFLSELRGLVPCGWGLRKPAGLSEPFSWSADIGYEAWPFPQMFIGSGRGYVLKQDAVQSINLSNWARASVTLYDADDPFTVDTLSGDGLWHIADCGSYWVAVNGSEALMRDSSGKILVTDDPGVTTCEYHRGRLLLGGLAFSSNYDSSSDWSIWKASLGSRSVWWSSIGGGNCLPFFSDSYNELGDSPLEHLTDGGFDDGSDWTLTGDWTLGVGEISYDGDGGGVATQAATDFAYQCIAGKAYRAQITVASEQAVSLVLSLNGGATANVTTVGTSTVSLVVGTGTTGLSILAAGTNDLAVTNICLFGPYDAAKPLVLDNFLVNDTGWASMPSDVLALKSWGQNVIAFCASDTMLLTQRAEPTPCFGVERLLGVGICGRGGVGGTNTDLLMVDATGDCWRFVAGNAPMQLRTSELFGDLTLADVVVTYQAGEGMFHVTDGVEAFVANEHGIARGTVAPTSIVGLNGIEYAIQHYIVWEELVGNGTFATAVGWTLAAGVWTVAAGKLTCEGESGDASITSAKTLVPGDVYQVEMIIARTAGTVWVSVGGGVGKSAVTSGVYRWYLTAGNSNQLLTISSTAFNGTVDDVSMTRVGGRFEVGSDWSEHWSARFKYGGGERNRWMGGRLVGSGVSDVYGQLEDDDGALSLVEVDDEKTFRQMLQSERCRIRFESELDDEVGLTGMFAYFDPKVRRS